MKNVIAKGYRGILAIVMMLSILSFTTANVHAWRSTSTRQLFGSTLYAKADLPYFSDFSGGGNWKAQAIYYGSKNSNRLKLSWSFYTIGGSVSFFLLDSLEAGL